MPTGWILRFLLNDSTQIGTLVNKELTSKDAINKPASCSYIILANPKESFKVKSLEVRCRNKETKNFTHLEVLVLTAGKTGVNLGQPLTSGLYIVDYPYIIAGCEPVDRGFI